ncbi:MAG: glycosyltransferase [Candidatus Paceibacterota bacterium]
MKPKIFVIHSSGSLSGGERVSLSIYHGLHSFFTFVFFSPQRAIFLEDMGVISYFPSSLNILTTVFTLYRCVIRESPDIVHAHGVRAGFLIKIITPILLIRGKKPRIIYTIHGLHFLHRKTIITGCLFLFEKISNYCVDRIICVGQDDGKLLISKNLAPLERVQVIENGVKNTAVLPHILRKEIKDFISKRFVIGTIARLHYQKDIKTLLRAMNLLDQHLFCLLVIGSGPDLNMLQKEANNLHLTNILFLGDGQNTLFFIKEVFDVSVLSTRWEGLPIALLESMILKKPVIASRVHGVVELVHNNQTGLLFERGDFNALARCIRFIQEHPKDSEYMVQRAYQLVTERYSISGMVSQYHVVYNSLISHTNHENSSNQ